MKSAIVIVNYRTADLVCDCLHSLNESHELSSYSVIIVDNNSEDSSLEVFTTLIREQGWEKLVTILPQIRNGGFAAGNNAAIQFLLRQDSPPDYLMLLNPDTIVRRNAINSLARFLVENQKVGIVGAQLEDRNNLKVSSARRYPTILSELDGGTRLKLLSRALKKKRVSLPIVDFAHQCEWVSGAAMMVRREVFEQIGLMDELFFLYFEELDFCRRASNAGWEIWLEPASRIIHFEGQSTGIEASSTRRGKYWYDSRRRYLIKHLGITRWILADVLWGVGRISLLLRVRLKMGGDISGDPRCFFHDLIWGDLCAIMNGEVKRTKAAIVSISKSSENI